MYELTKADTGSEEAAQEAARQYVTQEKILEAQAEAANTQ